MKIGEISRRTGYAVAHLRRLAHDGEIPSTIRPKKAGGHFKFHDTPALRAWIATAGSRRVRKKRRAALRTVRRKFKPERGDKGRGGVLESARQLARDYAVAWSTMTPQLRREVRRLLRPIFDDGET